MNNEARKVTIPMDFSESAFLEAVHLGKILPSEATVVVTPGDYPSALEMQAKYHCKVVFVPDEFFKNRDQWIMIGPESSVWSPGA